MYNVKSAYLLRKKYEEIVTIYTSASNRKLKTCIQLSFILVLFINILNYFIFSFDFYSFIVCFSDFIILFHVLIYVSLFYVSILYFFFNVNTVFFCNFSTLTPISDCCQGIFYIFKSIYFI